VKKSPELAAKISQEINKISTCRKFFFPCLACISADYAFLKKVNVIILSAKLPNETARFLRAVLLNFLIHLCKK
jgi:hypothetical protein